VYSVTIGDDFIIPKLNAYDNFNDDIPVSVTTNLNLEIVGTYSITYTAENEIGISIIVITIHVIEHHDELPTITFIEEIPKTYYTKEKFIVPDAVATDYLGNDLIVYKSHEEFTVYFPGIYYIEYFAQDELGNSLYLYFEIEFIDNPDNTTVPVEVELYYESTMGLSGEDLQIELYEIISDMELLRYSDTSVPLSYIDRDLDNASSVFLIYNSARVNYAWDSGATWNKEHVWAKSLFGLAKMSNSHRGMGSDMHNLRAANPVINSTRGNKIFVDGSGSYGAVGSGWYPGDEHIGDVARIILYMHIAWNYEINVGTLEMFLTWHELDPVSPFERQRNDRIYEYQNNRNPFIDFPDFAEYIWGTQ